MIQAAYLLYAVLVVTVLLWGRRRLPEADRVPFALAMLLLPPLLAVAAVAILLNTENSLPVVAVPLAAGATLLVAGLTLRGVTEPDGALVLRLAGWALIAGILLIPAIIALLAPLAGLLAFTVPDWRRERSAERAT